MPWNRLVRALTVEGIVRPLQKRVVAKDVILAYPAIGQDPQPIESIELKRALAPGSRRHPADEMHVA